MCFAAAPNEVALTIAGHTHCGQVNLPFAGAVDARLPGSERWPCGLYEEQGRKLYVSGGLGTLDPAGALPPARKSRW